MEKIPRGEQLSYKPITSDGIGQHWIDYLKSFRTHSSRFSTNMHSWKKHYDLQTIKCSLLQSLTNSGQRKIMAIVHMILIFQKYLAYNDFQI